MDALLGNYLSVGDLIVVHLCGQKKQVNITKTGEYLGLTITDNAHGRAFVKRIKSNDAIIEQIIQPGDHIAAINSESMIGMRHYEVARAIREMPQNTDFTMHLIEPKRGKENQTKVDTSSSPTSLSNKDESRVALSPLNKATNHVIAPNADQQFDTLDELINSSLPIDRLLARCADRAESNQIDDVDHDRIRSPDIYKAKINSINRILDSFLGINDNALAVQIYRLARDNRASFDGFVSALDKSEIRLFNFSKETESQLWSVCVSEDYNNI